MISTEVIIVGAGPVGLELAAGLKRAGVDYLQFDAQQLGYTISWFAPHTRFFSSNERISIAGVPLQTLDQSKATREEYLQYLRSVATILGLKVNAYESVEKITRVGREFDVMTAPLKGRQTYRAKYVVLATGGTARPRMLGVPGEDLPHVSHYLADSHTYFGQKVLVVGGRNSAVEAALRCYHGLADVSISYRASEFDESIKYWLLPEINSLIKAGRVHGYFNTQVVEIRPGSVTLAPATGVRGDARNCEVAADFVLLMTGYMADMTLARSAGIETVGVGEVPVHDSRTMETNVPGLFVAGTAVGGTQEKYRLFIENCHVHVDRIVAAITGRQVPTPAHEVVGPPES